MRPRWPPRISSPRTVARTAAPADPRRGRATPRRGLRLPLGGDADRATHSSEDWLRDNHHVVQDQVRAVRQDLPRRFYTQLPKLANGEFAGYPRVYSLARDLVLHTAGRFDLQTLIGYVSAYQRGAVLNIGELWAIPIMLRVALVDELRRRAEDVLEASRNREEARRWGLASPGDDRSRQDDRRAAAQDGEPAAPAPRLRRRAAAVAARSAVDRGAAWQALHRALEAQGDSPEAILGASISAKRRTSSPSATSSRRCGWCRRATGRSSSSASASSSGSCRMTPRAPTPGWIFRPAIATGTRSSSWRAARSQGRRSPNARSRSPGRT